MLSPELSEEAPAEGWSADDALGPNQPIQFQIELDEHWAFGEAEGDSPLLAMVKSSFVSLEVHSGLSEEEKDLLGVAGGLPIENFWTDSEDRDSEPPPPKPAQRQ